MRKILFGLIGLFIVSQFMFSCSSESDVLSQFSKRKYLKKYKAKNVKYEDNIDERQNDLAFENTFASNDEIVYAYNNEGQLNGLSKENIELTDQIELSENKNVKISNISNTITNDYSFWNNYNRKVDLSFYESTKLIKHKTKSTADTSAIVLIILCVLIITAPLAVYLYEGSITANFWLDLALLLLLIGAAIYGLLVCFADVSIA